MAHCHPLRPARAYSGLGCVVLYDKGARIEHSKTIPNDYRILQIYVGRF